MDQISENVKVLNNDMDMNISGVNVSIGKLLGEKIVEEVITKITPEEIDLIFQYMHDKTWKKDYTGEKMALKYDEKHSYSGVQRTPPTLAQYAESLLSDRLKETIQIKVEEIIKSEEFLSKADQIAQEIVDYATEGYKKDMKQRIYERLIGNVTDSEPGYCGMSLKGIIRQEIYGVLNN